MKDVGLIKDVIELPLLINDMFLSYKKIQLKPNVVVRIKNLMKLVRDVNLLVQWIS